MKRYSTVQYSVCVLQYLEEILKYCNYVFTLVFVIEAILKLIAFGLQRFFKERCCIHTVSVNTPRTPHPSEKLRLCMCV